MTSYKSARCNLFTIAMLIMTIVMVGMYLLRPIYDPDFFWHLKTGELIWNNKALLTLDPFAIPPPPQSSPRTEFILSSYWLSQLIMHAFYAIGGMVGIALLRVILISSFLLILFRWSKNINGYVIAVIALGTVQLLETYPVERPQFISFICFALLLLLLRQLSQPRDNAPPLWIRIAPLSTLMVFWANLHGGYLVGQVILLFYLVAEGCKFFHPALNPLPRHTYRVLFIAGIAALAASFISPYPVTGLKMLLATTNANNILYTSNIEYYSVIKYFNQTQDFNIVLNLFFMVFIFAVFLYSRYRTDITWLGLLAATAVMGCQHIRYLPFFLIAGTLFLILYFKQQRVGCVVPSILLGLLVITGSYCIRDEPGNLRSVISNGWVSSSEYPVAAADFIIKQNLKGNLYNKFSWGGYLIWRLGPEIRIFCDGRQLDAGRYWEWLVSEVIPSAGEPPWKKLFSKYDIDTAVIPMIDANGSMYPLFGSLRMDNNWLLVFAKDNSAVFRKRPLVQKQ